MSRTNLRFEGIAVIFNLHPNIITRKCHFCFPAPLFFYMLYFEQSHILRSTEIKIDAQKYFLLGELKYLGVKSRQKLAYYLALPKTLCPRENHYLFWGIVTSQSIFVMSKDAHIAQPNTNDTCNLFYCVWIICTTVYLYGMANEE